MDEKELLQQTTRVPSPSECITPSLDSSAQWTVRVIRDEERATRIALNICMDIYKILFFEEYGITTKNNNRWWAEALCSTGEIGILRSITTGSTRWSSLALRHILRFLRSAQSITQLANNAPDLFRLLFEQGLAQTTSEVNQAQQKASNEWKSEGVVTFGVNEHYALKQGRGTPPPLVPNLIQRIYDLANATLDHFTDTGACYVYDSLPLLEAEDIHELLTPELLTMKLVNQVSVLSQEKTLSMDMYLDYSGSMTSPFKSTQYRGLDFARVCGYMADILWRHGIINNIYVFNSHVHEIFSDEQGTIHRFRRPEDFLRLEPSGGTDFNNVLLHSKNRPAVVFTDGDAAADPSTPMNDKLMWVIFTSKDTRYLRTNAILSKFIDKGRVIGVSPVNLSVFPILPTS